MNTFEALLKHRPGRPDFPEVRGDEDPLRVADALREAQILDVWCECVTQRAGILLEMRMAFAGGGGRAALLVGWGVRDFAWECSDAAPDDGSYSFGHAWNVAGSLVTRRGPLLELEFSCIPNARLRVAARGFDYYLAEVPGLYLAPPDYGEGPDDLVRRDLPDWRRPIGLVWSSRRLAD